MNNAATSGGQLRPGPSLRRWVVLLASGLVALGAPASGLGAGAAGAAGSPPDTTCSGTPGSPGTLAGGSYTSVTINGVCDVNAGQVTVSGTVTVTAGSALIAAFAQNDKTHSGTSGLTAGNIVVDGGATLILGCENPAFPCFDNSSLDSPDTVHGSIVATSPLGVLVHDSTVGSDVVEAGGGGGLSCTPSGIFAAQFKSPPYSDYEDNAIGAHLRVTGLKSCWAGALRNRVGGSVTFSDNAMADPDANEVLTNQIKGNLICAGNSPANQYGDSGGKPNVVGGFAVGQCSFTSKAPNPAPHGTLQPIAVQSASPPGYWLAGGDGGVFSFGVPFYGSAAGTITTSSVVGIAATPGGGGYCLVAGNGAVSSIGPHREGCTGLTGTLAKPVVGTAAVPGGDGNYMTAADGGVFTSGTAAFYGSAASLKLAAPVVGIATTPFGNGYYLAGADGGVFSYGPGASFAGSAAGLRLAKPIVGIAVDPATGGYWLVGADGGVFSFHAPFFGSLGGLHLAAPIVGIAAAPGGNGYYLVGADGGVFAIGPGAHFSGSAAGLHLAKPVVGIALG